jgi:hypothetical protein
MSKNLTGTGFDARAQHQWSGSQTIGGWGVVANNINATWDLV